MDRPICLVALVVMPFSLWADQPKSSGEGCAAEVTELDKFQGKWECVRKNGAGKWVTTGMRMVFQGKKAEVFQVNGQGGLFCIIDRLDAGTTPAEIDCTDTDGKTTRKRIGIYKLDGDILTICSVREGGVRPRQVTQEPRGYSVAILRRAE